MGKLRRSLRIHCCRKSRISESSQPNRAAAKDSHTANGPHQADHGTGDRPSKNPIYRRRAGRGKPIRDGVQERGLPGRSGVCVVLQRDDVGQQQAEDALGHQRTAEEDDAVDGEQFAARETARAEAWVDQGEQQQRSQTGDAGRPRAEGPGRVVDDVGVERDRIDDDDEQQAGDDGARGEPVGAGPGARCSWARGDSPGGRPTAAARSPVGVVGPGATRSRSLSHFGLGTGRSYPAAVIRRRFGSAAGVPALVPASPADRTTPRPP